MILEISTPNRPSLRKPTWKQQLRKDLYTRNREVIMASKKDTPDRRELQIRRQAQSSLLDMFKQEEIIVKDRSQTVSCHSYYSSFIPLQMQSKFDDELTCTFPYLRHLEEKMRINDRLLLLLQISQYMKKCKEEGRVDFGWQACLQKYICGLDSIRAAQLYLELKKRGTEVMQQLYAKYGQGCLRQVFFDRICSSGHFLRKEQPTMKTMLLSVDASEQINEVTMPKTMKNLFCSICMIYDCGQHLFDENIKERSFQYISPLNIRPENQRIQNAIIICQAYQQLLSLGKVTPIGDNITCCSKCYKLLDTQQWKKIQSLRMKILSPLVKGLMKLGIEIYSYSPCDIWNLLKQQTNEKTPSTITCSLVFLFLVEEYNIMGRLELKLNDSQANMLMRQYQTDTARLPEPPRRTRRKIKISHAEHTTNISSCCHYFVNQDPIDINCDSCSCRQRGFCIPQCLCQPSCPIRKRGCNCKKDDCKTKRCPCFSNKQQCDPELCKGCFSSNNKKNFCRNNQIQLGKFKKVRVGKSTIAGAGLGLFAAQSIKKDEIVMIYSGELIQQSLDLLRESLSIDNTFYNFGSPEGTIDARFMGNQSRFINHGDQGKENLRSENILTQGRYKIGFYAERDIEMGEELFFDYDGEGELYKNYKDKYPFINSKAKNRQKL